MVISGMKHETRLVTTTPIRVRESAQGQQLSRKLSAKKEEKGGRRRYCCRAEGSSK